jgi:cell division protein FtsQ
MPGRVNRRRKAQPSKPKLRLPAINWHRVVGGLAAACVVAAVYVSSVWLMDQPITAVSIEGPFERVSAVQLQDALANQVQTGFLSADIGKIQRAAVRLPWIATASVQRRWPGTLVVTVTEEEPAACWGKEGLLNQAGELFAQAGDHLPAELPRLNGPDGTEAKVAAMYFRVEQQLEQRGLAALSLDLDARGAWTFRLNNGVSVRLGAAAVEQRLSRFFRILDLGVPMNAEQGAYVDMRYPNGFVIGWREAQSADSEPEVKGEPRV